MPDPIVRVENRYERVIVLLLWASCCYGVQLLFERQKRAEGGSDGICRAPGAVARLRDVWQRRLHIRLKTPWG